MGGKDPSLEANKQLQGIIPMEQRIFNPYIQRGAASGQLLGQEYGAMNRDPTGFMNRVMQQYQPSQELNFQRQQALDAASNDAAAQGRRGGTMDLRNQANIYNSLTSSHMQNWMNNVMGAQNRGLAGQENFRNIGYQASRGLGGDLANVAGTMAQNAAQAKANDAANRNGALGNVLGVVGTVVGGIYGGPGGAMAGAGAGKAIGNGLGNMGN